MGNLLQSLQWRYATKQFDATRRVSKEDLDYLKECIRLAPSSYGLQPYRVLIISRKDLQEELVPASYRQRQVADASHVFVICSETEMKKSVDKYVHLTGEIRDVPKDKLMKFSEMIMNKIQGLGEQGVREWTAKQCYIAMTHLLIACAEKGIDACPIEGFIPGEYSRILDLTTRGLEPVLVVPVGYRAPEDKYAGVPKVRKPSGEMFWEIT